MPQRKPLLSLGLALALITLSFLVRGAAWEGLLPPNFSAVAAAALFAGFLFRRNLLAALAVPLAAMVLSDLMIGGYDWRQMIVVYAALAAPALLGRRIAAPISNAARAAMVPLSSLAASMLFFLASNAAVWAWSGMYDHSPAGFLDCFVSALPFFRYTILGDLAFSLSLFALYAAATATRRIPHPAAVTNPA